MNERIKELVVQAGGVRNYGYERGEPIDRVAFSVDNLEKFAELIVRECISTLEEKIHRSIDNEGDEIWADLILKEHFGVEE